MGPVQTKQIGGRGDKNQAAKQALDTMIREEMDIFCAKYLKLDKESKDELQALFDDEDVGSLLADEYVKEMATMFIDDTLWNPEDKKQFLDAIVAFIDAHPV